MPLYYTTLPDVYTAKLCIQVKKTRGKGVYEGRGERKVFNLKESIEGENALLLYYAPWTQQNSVSRYLEKLLEDKKRVFFLQTIEDIIQKSLTQGVFNPFRPRLYANFFLC